MVLLLTPEVTPLDHIDRQVAPAEARVATHVEAADQALEVHHPTEVLEAQGRVQEAQGAIQEVAVAPPAGARGVALVDQVEAPVHQEVHHLAEVVDNRLGLKNSRQ